MEGTENSAKAVYLSYSQGELDDQYNQRSLVPDTTIYRHHKRVRSKWVQTHFKGIYDVAYGSSPDEILDIFPADHPGGPCLLFLHGGAWKNGHKDDSSYVAEHFVPKGVNVIIVNFSLVPSVRLREQVRQAREAVSWVCKNATSFGGNPDAVYVTGHSSGGHLTGMMAVTEWSSSGLLKGAAAFSGMFDLEPVQLSWRNSYLRLTREEALSLSPIRMIPDNPMPIVVGCGTGELQEFQRQSREFAKAWRDRGYSCVELVFEGLNHHEVQELYSDPNGSMVKAVCELMDVI